MNRERLFPAFAAAAAAAVYLAGIGNGFALDDVFIIQNNPRIHDLSEILFAPYWPGPTGADLGIYRPLATFAYALQWRLGNGAAWLFHVISILLHAAAAVLAYQLVRRFASAPAALVAALLFAVHPVRSEAVANVVGQAELLCALAVLGACVLHVARQEDGAASLRTDVALLMLYALALGAKESGVMLPALLLLLDVAARRTRHWRRRVPLALGFTLVLALYFAVRAQALDGMIFGADAAPALPYLRGDDRLLNAFRAFPEYARLLLLPVRLAADYAPAVILPVTRLTPMAALGLVLLLAAVALTLLAWRWPRTGLVAGWFLLAILPVANLLFPVGVVVAERTLYLPALALSFAVAFAWDAVPPRHRQLAVAAAALVILLFAVRTWTRVPTWRNTITVWNTLAREHPESYRGQWIQGALAAGEGRIEDALARYHLAYRIYDQDPQFLYDFANVRINLGDYHGALELTRRSAAAQPDNPAAHVQLAYTLALTGAPQPAIAALDSAERIGADSAATEPVRAAALEAAGRWAEAVPAWQAAVRHSAGRAWIHRAFLVRAFHRADDLTASRAQLDSLDRDNSGSELAIVTVAAVRAALDSGCWGDRPGDACGDPLRPLRSPWLGHAKTPQPLQNARPRVPAVPAAPPSDQRK